MKKLLSKRNYKHERGQAIIVIAFALVGLVAMVGLVTDTGQLLIQYGKLKRSIDAAAIAAAQQYSLPADEISQENFEAAAVNFMNLNQSTGIIDISVHSCEETGPDRPSVCNEDPDGHPEDNRKLVEVTASQEVRFGFLSVIGIRSTIISASSVGEAATLDIVLVVDTSGSMAYETRSGGNSAKYDSDAPGLVSENPEICNYSLDHPCQPLDAVKEAALAFVDTLNFNYDRVGIVALTGQDPGTTTDGNLTRNPVQVLPLSLDETLVRSKLENLHVFQPHRCNETLVSESDFADDPGVCIRFTDVAETEFYFVVCQSFEALRDTGSYYWPACPSSNVGGALRLAAATLSGTDRRLDSFWVALVLMSGPANATDTPDNFPDSLPGGVPAVYPDGYCPATTYYPTNLADNYDIDNDGTVDDTDLNDDGLIDYKPCTDGYPSKRHSASDTTFFTYGGNPLQEISIYDADDYARDRADALANLLSGTGVTIYSIGLGDEVRDTSKVAPGEPAMAETLLKYIAEDAGRSTVNHGQYFYAPTFSQLKYIFGKIAENIATKISQ